MVRKRSGAKFIASDCDCGDIRIKSLGDEVLVVCPCKPPRKLKKAERKYDGKVVCNNTA